MGIKLVVVYFFNKMAEQDFQLYPVTRSICEMMPMSCSLRNHSFITLWGRGLLIASAVFLSGSIAIAEIGDHITPRKDVFYCWLLVFFHAYIGTFIANRVIKSGFTGFFVWEFLVNGLRAALFLILLLSVVKMDVVNVRAFVLMTFYGYFVFLAAEIFGLHKHTQRIAKDPKCDRKDD